MTEFLTSSNFTRFVKTQIVLEQRYYGQRRSIESPSKQGKCKKIAESTLLRIVLSNKQRGGEAQRMKTNHFINRPNWASVQNEDIMKSLSNTEQLLCQKMDLVKIPGKRKPVPVILSPSMKISIELWIAHQTDLRIDSDYVFANPDSK